MPQAEVVADFVSHDSRGCRRIYVSAGSTDNTETTAAVRGNGSPSYHGPAHRESYVGIETRVIVQVERGGPMIKRSGLGNHDLSNLTGSVHESLGLGGFEFGIRQSGSWVHVSAFDGHQGCFLEVAEGAQVNGKNSLKGRSKEVVIPRYLGRLLNSGGSYQANLKIIIVNFNRQWLRSILLPFGQRDGYRWSDDRIQVKTSIRISQVKILHLLHDLDEVLASIGLKGVRCVGLGNRVAKFVLGAT